MSGKAGEFEAPPKFDPSEFKWGSQTGSNLSMFAPASFGDNKLGSQATPLKWEVPANFGMNPTPAKGVSANEQEEGEEEEYYEGDEGENGQEDYLSERLGGMGTGPFATPAPPGGASPFPFSSAAFSPSAFSKFPSLSGPPSTVSAFSPAATAATATPVSAFSPANFNPSSSSFTSTFTTSTPTTPAFPFASTPFTGFSTTTFAASSTPFSAPASSTFSTTTTFPASSPFTFHVASTTTSTTTTTPFVMSTSAFSAGTSMFSSDDAKTSFATPTFTAPTFPSFTTPAFPTSAFGPNAFAPAPFAIPSTPAVGGFLREPSFWSVEADAPVFNKNRGFITKTTPVDTLEAKLQTWLNDAGVTAADVEHHRAAFATFRKEYKAPKIPKHIFQMDAARAFRGEEHQALFILVITYLEQQFKDYHQGLGLISAFLLLLTDPGTVVALTTKWNTDEKYAPNLWHAESIVSATDAYVFWDLAAQHMPKLFANLKSVTPEFFYQKYFCAMCVHLLPFESLFIYFGSYAKHGYKAVISFALNIVAHLEKQILSKPEQHVLLELLRLEGKDVTNAMCLAIVSDPKDWKLGNHQWFVAKRVEVFKTYLEKRMKNAKAANEVQQIEAECGLCKATADLYCEECGIDICEDCADANKGGHDQEEHTTYTQEEKPEAEEKTPPATPVVNKLVAKTAAVSLTPTPVEQAKPQAKASPAAPKVQSPAPAPAKAEPKPDSARKPQVASKSGGLAALRSKAPTLEAVLQALDKLTQEKLKVYTDSGIEDELRNLLGNNKDKQVVEDAAQRVRRRADPRAFNEEEFDASVALLTQFEEQKDLKEVLVGIRQFWQITRAEMMGQFLLLKGLIQPTPCLEVIRQVYRKVRKLEKAQAAGSTQRLETAKAKLAAAQRLFVISISGDSLKPVVANAALRHF